MLKFSVFLALFLPAAAMAANTQGMNPEDMQGMMEQMQKMQTCMEQIDESRMNELQSRSEQFSQEVEALCAQGQRDLAQQKALVFGREVAADPTMKQLKKCTSFAEGMIPNMPEIAVEEDYKNKHVCDQ